MRFKIFYITQGVWATPLLFVSKCVFGLIFAVLLGKKSVRVEGNAWVKSFYGEISTAEFTYGEISYGEIKLSRVHLMK